MKREMVENRGWKESSILCDDWIFRETEIRSAMKLWSSDIKYISKQGHNQFEIYKVKFFIELLPKYNFEDINGFSALLHADDNTAEDVQIEITNSVVTAPKGLLKYISNIVANSELKVTKVPKSSGSKATNKRE